MQRNSERRNRSLRILIDAHGCPVVDETLKIAKQFAHHLHSPGHRPGYIHHDAEADAVHVKILQAVVSIIHQFPAVLGGVLLAEKQKIM